MELKKNIKTSSPIFITLFILLLVDLAVGDPRLFTLINLEMNHLILDFACGYGSIILFSIASLISLIMLYNAYEDKKIARIDSLVATLLGPLSYFLGSILKVVFQRPRPFEVLPARTVGLWHTSTFSFPSTTTMLVFGFAVSILFKKPKLGVLTVSLASFIGFSVIYTGFHYPSDVIVGALFSTIIVLSTQRVFYQLISKALMGNIRSPRGGKSVG